MRLRLAACFILLVIGASAAKAQNAISGIVVDSLSLSALSGVHVKVKNSSNITASKKDGSFLIMAADFDTLVFTFVGYHDLEYPLFGPEADILIRMKEDVVVLKEVTVTALPEVAPKGKYQVSDGSSYTKSPTPNFATGVMSPITYFSKAEKEKRKLIKLRTENKKIKTYVEVVNDREFREDVMMAFAIEEKEYYNLLAKFNQSHREAAYLNNPDEIKKRLFNFIRYNLR
jgi:hypothetical protein